MISWWWTLVAYAAGQLTVLALLFWLNGGGDE